MEYMQLVSVMEKLVSLHRELVTREQEKIKLILDQDWRRLEEQVDRSRQVLRRIEETERQRLEIVGMIGGDPNHTLTQISGLLPDEGRDELHTRGKTLRSLLVDLKNLNLRCEQLIASSLEVVDFTLSLLSGTGSNGKTYSGDGEERGNGREHPSLVFDVKA